MTPQQLAKSDSEHAHQRAFFAYVSVARLHGFNVADEWASGIQLDIAKDRYSRTDSGITDLTWLHAVPNGGSRGDTDKSRMIQGGKMKAEGVLSGVADVVLPIPRLATATLQTMFGSATPFHGVLCGLYIEMKKPAERPNVKAAKAGCQTNR